jgi:hypothetical protein
MDSPWYSRYDGQPTFFNNSIWNVLEVPFFQVWKSIIGQKKSKNVAKIETVQTDLSEVKLKITLNIQIEGSPFLMSLSFRQSRALNCTYVELNKGNFYRGDHFAKKHYQNDQRRWQSIL